MFWKKEKTVGKQVTQERIQQFYWTYSTSTNPPVFQRYRISVEDGIPYFYHETREGDHWPLTEADVTVSGVKELTPEEWAYLYELWSGGTVRAREESLDSGDSGPWTYLYWDGDRGDVQQFEFESYTKATQFKAYCEELKTQQLGLT